MVLLKEMKNKNFQHKLDEMQSLAIAAISHDFRTPLNGIITTLYAIDLAKYPREFKEKYDVMMNRSHYLKCLIEDILVQNIYQDILGQGYFTHGKRQQINFYHPNFSKYILNNEINEIIHYIQNQDIRI